jgi:hypothetical protein
MEKWNGKEATATGLFFSVAVLCFSLMALLKVAAFYPFCLNVILEC